MATYIPKIVDNKVDLKCALKTGEVVIVITDRDFFVAIDKELVKDKAGKTTKKIGKDVITAGVGLSALFYIPLGFFTGGIGWIPLAVTSAGAVGSILGSSLTRFKEYASVIDYAEKRIILLKKKGKQTFNENTDTIQGIDLNSVIQKNTH